VRGAVCWEGHGRACGWPRARAAVEPRLVLQIVHEPRASRLFQQARPALSAYRRRPGSLRPEKNSIRTARRRRALARADAALRVKDTARGSLCRAAPGRVSLRARALPAAHPPGLSAGLRGNAEASTASVRYAF
jgi:hypothetical protein